MPAPDIEAVLVGAGDIGWCGPEGRSDQTAVLLDGMAGIVFTLGDNATVMVKPGSDLYKFLSRHRGRKIKVSMVDAAGPELSKLQR